MFRSGRVPQRRHHTDDGTVPRRCDRNRAGVCRKAPPRGKAISQLSRAQERERDREREREKVQLHRT